MNLANTSDDIELLNSLGLTINEAKIIIALCQLRTATAKKIAQVSGVAREVVYQAMPKLQEKAIVEELITSPKKFKAPTIKEVYAILLQHKKEENRELCKRIRETLHKHQKESFNGKENQEEISLIHTGRNEQCRISQEYKKVQKSVDLTFSAGKFLQWSQHYAEWSLKEAVKRNVKMRILIEQKLLKQTAISPEIFSPFQPYLKNVEFKYTEDLNLAELMIFDKNKIYLSIKKEKDINKMCWLCTKNPAMVELANRYFEVMWQAKPENKLQTQYFATAISADK
ncbi:MAG: hypothetical protein NWF09_04205 [Candidatus Bathyarchaeota archaeon]|nr:hypothetical protein [Candidatus Bathyarchaeota archaeon]